MRQITPIGLICAVIGLMAWVIQDWSSPIKPLLLMLGLTVAVFAARYTWDVFKSERALTTRELLPQPLEVVAALVALGIAAGWMAPPMRASAVKFAALQSRLNVEKALSDEAHSVKVAACLQLFKDGVAKSANRLMASLDNNPAVAEHCFKEAKSKDKTSTQFIGERLSQRWWRLMMTQTLNQTPPVCEYVQPYELITNEHTSFAGKASLLACATSSINPQTRRCCAEHLNKRGNLAVYMGPTSAVPDELGAQLYPMLAALTFKFDLLDEQSSKIATSLTTQTQPTQRWVADLGCQLSRTGKESVEGIKGLISFVEGGPCRPKDEQARLIFRSPETWDLACEVMQQHPMEHPTAKAMCAGMERALVGLAVEEAKRRMKVTVRTWYLVAIAAASEDTMGLYHGRMSWAARKKVWNAMADGKLSFGELNRADLWNAFGFNSKRDMFTAGLLNAIPGVEEFLSKDPQLRREMEEFNRFDANNEESSKRFMTRSFTFVGDVLNGNDPTAVAMPMSVMSRMKNHKEGYAKSKDLMADSMGKALGSKGVRSTMNSGTSNKASSTRSSRAGSSSSGRGTKSSISIQ